MDFMIIHGEGDELVCHACKAYLTVLPVKIYPGGAIKCGTCVYKDDGGIVSLYNLIAERTIFKCIHRFDGCTQFLGCDAVLPHEEVCEYKNQQTCPLCCDCKEKSTIWFIDHFRKRHSDAFLKKPLFKIQQFNKTKYFLYQCDDHLFLICTRCIEVDDEIALLFLNFRHLGDSNDANQFEINLCITNNEEENAQLIKIVPHQKSDIEVSLNMTGFQNINVHVFFNVQYTTKLVCNTIDGGVTIKKHFAKIMNKNSFKNINFQKRLIYISDDFAKSYLNPELKDAYTLMLYINGIIEKINLSCINCSLVTYPGICINCPGEYRDKYDFKINIFENRYYLCEKNKNLANYLDSDMVQVEMSELKKISLFCIWECENFFNLEDLDDHEYYCKNQPNRLCPVDECEHSCQPFQFVNHFKEHHPLMTPPKLDVMNLFELNRSNSPINSLVLVGNVFLFIEFVWNESFWMVSLSCELKNVRPRGFVYSEGKQRYLGLIKGKLKLWHHPKVYVKCYLANPSKRFNFDQVIESDDY